MEAKMEQKTGDKVVEGSFEQRDAYIKKLLHSEETFDIIRRSFVIGNRQACIYVIDGYLKGDLCEKVMEFFYNINPEDMPEDFSGFLHKKTPFADLKRLNNEKDFLLAFLSGMCCLLIDGYEEILALDFRNYPSRSVDEPVKDKVLRGSRDGFIESLVPNVALIRRRIRDTSLIFSMKNIGRTSKTDVSVCYMEDRVDKKVLETVSRKMDSIQVDSLTMNAQSLAECIYPRGWWNPFPKFKFTERPDTAAACLLEGSILILVDNSSAAMIIPTSLFDILEDTNDYYLPPVTGSYLRLTRLLINFLAVFLTPFFVLLMKNPQWLPGWLEFINITDKINVAPALQFLILEVAIDGLRMASVSTPSVLTTPLSIIAGIVFGDYTVKSGWFNSQILLYMAFVAVANYTQNNMEFGYAIKFMRIILLVATGLFGLWGFIIGSVFVIAVPFCNRTLTGRNYLYPLFPFDKTQLLQRFFRISLHDYEKKHF